MSISYVPSIKDLEDLAKKGFEIRMYKAFMNVVMYEANYISNDRCAVRFAERSLENLIASCDLYLESL